MSYDENLPVRYSSPMPNKLEEIFKLQRELNDKTFAKGHEKEHPFFFVEPRLGWYTFSEVCALPWEHPLRQYWIGKFMQACIAEIGEMHETTAWKWWRGIEDTVGGDKAGETLQNARVEGIDALHFIISLFLLMGLNAAGAFEMYVGKHKVNQERQDSGYVDKTADDTHIEPGQTGL